MGLKIPRRKLRAGSSPAPGTILGNVMTKNIICIETDELSYIELHHLEELVRILRQNRKPVLKTNIEEIMSKRKDVVFKVFLVDENNEPVQEIDLDTFQKENKL